MYYGKFYFLPSKFEGLGQERPENVIGGDLWVDAEFPPLGLGVGIAFLVTILAQKVG